VNLVRTKESIGKVLGGSRVEGRNVVEFAKESRESYVPVVVEQCVAEDEDTILWVKES
jgi:hypothetical protein